MNRHFQFIRCRVGRHDFRLTYSELSHYTECSQKMSRRYVEFTCNCCGKLEKRETYGYAGSGCLYYYFLTPEDKQCRFVAHPSNELTWGTKHES